jgi:CO dehydrogenase nickel-insertion accessory protein CooC1
MEGKRQSNMTSEQCDVLKDIFRNVVAVGKRQQLQLAAYMAVFNIFKKMYPQYTEELDANLEAASNATVPQDKSFAQFELATEKFLSTPFDSLSVSDLSQIHEIIKQKFSN